MSSSKLSDPEKQEIVKLYQEVPEETTITLAERYGVSSSTVRRVLQNAIAKEIYDTLTQQKQRLHRTGKKSERNTQKLEEESTSITELESEPLSQPSSSEPETPSSSDITSTLKRRRKRSSAIEAVQSTDSEAAMPSESVPSESIQYSKNSSPRFEELSDQDFLSQNGEFDDEFDPDEDEEEDDFEADLDSEDDEFYEPPLPFMGTTQVQILPLTEASLPKTCYLVIDRSAELVAKPLKAFSELGQIPPDEFYEKTLPVFDNHRVASRFSARNQRVFKVPDSQLLHKTASYLQAKGITRLLIDGQVYRF